MNHLELKNNIGTLLAQNQVAQALEKARALPLPFRGKELLASLANQLARTEEDYAGGIISYEERSRAESKVVRGVQNLLAGRYAQPEKRLISTQRILLAALALAIILAGCLIVRYGPATNPAPTQTVETHGDESPAVIGDGTTINFSTTPANDTLQ
ncbi:MAG: hypothetical protein AAFN92_11205 [Bacteroidota bacterium]